MSKMIVGIVSLSVLSYLGYKVVKAFDINFDDFVGENLDDEYTGYSPQDYKSPSSYDESTKSNFP